MSTFRVFFLVVSEYSSGCGIALNQPLARGHLGGFVFFDTVSRIPLRGLMGRLIVSKTDFQK